MTTLTMSPATVIECGTCGGYFTGEGDTVECVGCGSSLSLWADVRPNMEPGERLVTVERDGVSVLAYFVESGE